VSQFFARFRGHEADATDQDEDPFKDWERRKAERKERAKKQEEKMFSKIWE